MKTMTPNAHRRLKAELKEMRQEIRDTVARIRMLEASGKFLDADDADAERIMLGHCWQQYRSKVAVYVTADVVKYSNVSPAAAARLSKGRV